MKKKAVNPKSSGGGGYVFENQAAAYFLSCLLTDRPPLDASLGTIGRIDFQTADRGWLLDDILLTLGEDRRCAFSVKSGPQVTSQRVSPEFVAAAWEQYVASQNNPFKPGSDRLGLITGSLPRQAKTALDCLLAKARAKDPNELPSHLMQPRCASKYERALFKSFACPADLAKKHKVGQEQVGVVLKHLEVLEFDFASSPSKQEQQAVGYCRAALASGDLKEAQSLWSELQTIANQMRPTGGTVELSDLLDRLKTRFHLKAHPHLGPDWNRLSLQTHDCLALIHDKIGSRLAIPRDDAVLAVERALGSSRFCVLLGPSGHGKTVIAKLWAFGNHQKKKVLWWNARSFEQPDFQTFEAKLQLKHPLRDVLASTPDPVAIVVIDGIDGVSDSALDNVATLVGALRLNAGSGPWHLLMTCQPEEWSRVQSRLSKAGTGFPKWSPVEVGELSTAETRQVAVAYPTLATLLLQRHLRQLLRRPKILDLLASGVETGSIPDARQWVGESDLIGWFWTSEVQKGPRGQQRARFLQLLAERTADLGQSSVSRTAFSVPELEPLQELIQDRICIEADERIRFSHGLYADWARQRFLIGQEPTLRNSIEPRLPLPSWHRAVRLYGLYLLEQKGVAAWQEAFNALTNGPCSLPLGQDLLLEAAIFASDPKRLLESLWPVLSSDDGQFLRRFLDRFLYVATLPNPSMVELVGEFGEEARIQLSLLYRIPYWPYWLPVLRFLIAHSSDVVKLSPKEAARLADLWLRIGPIEWPLRKEVAELALSVAEWILEWKRGKSGRVADHELEKTCFSAALAGAHELPDRVGQFAREASGRVKEEPHEEERDSSAVPGIPIARVPADIWGIPTGPMPPPWPDGPYQDADYSFREICFTGNAVFSLILANPSVAREVILALLIEAPKRRDSFGSHPLDEDLAIEEFHEWRPALYHTGPFLFFLRNRPDEGLELVLRLVNFATERWSANRKEAGEHPTELKLRFADGFRQFKGDRQVYNWYSEGPYAHPAGIALMALEKWFYDRIDAGESIDQPLQKILDKTNSAAFLGVLSAVGRKETSLLTGPLMPLLSASDIHEWELRDSLESRGYFAMAWWQKSERERKMAQEWGSLPHRRFGLNYVAQCLFLNVPDTEKFFETVREDWTKQVEALPKGDRRAEQLQVLIAKFDRQNYQVKHVPGKDDYLEFKVPESLKESEVEAAVAGEQLRVFVFQSQCRQILDQGKPLSQDQLESFWTELEAIPRVGHRRDSGDATLDPYAAVCGGIAVLARFHRDWLRTNPVREKWCAERISEAFTEALVPAKFDSSRSTYDIGRDSFLAELLPLLWAEDVADAELRRYVAQLAFNFHYGTVAILCRSASTVRQKLGQGFPMLLHLILRWAVVRVELEIARGHDRAFPPKFGRKVEAWIEGEVASFVNGTLPSRLPRWAMLLDEERRPRLPDGIVRAVLSRLPNPALDTELVIRLLSWMPSLDAACDKGERAQWIQIWRETLDYALKSLRFSSRDGGREDRLPYESDRWIMERVASLVLQMRPAEHPEEFWRPILDLGKKGHHWIESFLRSWFGQDRGDIQAPGAFVSTWREMIDYALASPDWVSGGWEEEENWRHLMGLEWLRINFNHWNSDRRDIVAQMSDAYERWAADHLHVSGSPALFAAFLAQPAAEPLVLKGLAWLKVSAAKCGDRFWTEHNLPERLIVLLDRCARLHMQKIAQDAGALDGFRFLLHGLAERRNPAAVALQESLAH